MSNFPQLDKLDDLDLPNDWGNGIYDFLEWLAAEGMAIVGKDGQPITESDEHLVQRYFLLDPEALAAEREQLNRLVQQLIS